LSPTDSDREAIRRRVVRIVCDCGEIDEARLQDRESFYRYGIDSLAGANIAYEIGLWTGVDVPAELVSEHDTVEKLTAYVMRLARNRR
jgi:acyl carrier protein